MCKHILSTVTVSGRSRRSKIFFNLSNLSSIKTETSGELMTPPSLYNLVCSFVNGSAIFHKSCFVIIFSDKHNYRKHTYEFKAKNYKVIFVRRIVKRLYFFGNFTVGSIWKLAFAKRYYCFHLTWHYAERQCFVNWACEWMLPHNWIITPQHCNQFCNKAGRKYEWSVLNRVTDKRVVKRSVWHS